MQNGTSLSSVKCLVPTPSLPKWLVFAFMGLLQQLKNKLRLQLQSAREIRPIFSFAHDLFQTSHLTLIVGPLLVLCFVFLASQKYLPFSSLLTFIFVLCPTVPQLLFPQTYERHSKKYSKFENFLPRPLWHSSNFQFLTPCKSKFPLPNFLPANRNYFPRLHLIQTLSGFENNLPTWLKLPTGPF